MGWPGLEEGIASEDRVPFEKMSILVVDDGSGYVRCMYLLPLNHSKMKTEAMGHVVVVGLGHTTFMPQVGQLSKSCVFV